MNQLQTIGRLWLPVRTIFLVAMATFLVSSCIRDADLNAEADIEGVDSVWLQTMLEQGVVKGLPDIRNTQVTFELRKGVDRTALGPRFNLTPGAVIEPASGTVRDFSKPQNYVVTSEDGRWKKNYTVSFNYPSPNRYYHFENYTFDDRGLYHLFYEVSDDDTTYNWASGNAGYMMCGMGKTPEEYPTVSVPDGYAGRGVQLRTCTTGTFGNQFKMPIAAGNLFIGEFKVQYATMRPLKATRFGKQGIDSKPLALRGYYKYKAGNVYTDRDKIEHPDIKDRCDIYAVLYEVDPMNFEPLYGDNVRSSERIVLLAETDLLRETDEWTEFNLFFTPRNGKVYDPRRMAADGYALAIVFTSSKDGAYFGGAVGSTLCVDEVELVCEPLE